MVHELTTQSVDDSLQWADVVAIGPGLGQNEWGAQALRQAGLSQADGMGCGCVEPAGNQSR
jgi:NAD(P)H-hydrate repair Nnr-like enzyme with NAD(P)H-hydrate dehydratase domain